jgi:hypothetical protein
MAKRPFRLKQIRLTTPTNESWVDVSFGHEFLTGACGERVAYGPLFAYCFRRFGYPDRGWDDYKELVRYYLSTPHPSLVLVVQPRVSDTSYLSLKFLVPMSLRKAIDDFGRRDQQAWAVRAQDWAEQQGLPEWMPEWMTIFNTEIVPALPHLSAAQTWRSAVNSIHYELGEEGTREYDLTHRVVEFKEAIEHDYEKIEPHPAYCERPDNHQEWPDDDPLKPLAEAALVALADLRTPVGVRDQAIDAFGLVEPKRLPLPPAASAGYPSGALGNTAAKEFGALHGLVLKLGKGNAKLGITRVLAAVEGQQEAA